jgi:hypothetical protein
MYSHVDDQGDPLIPFATYIHQEAPSTQSLPNLEIFDRFTDFPSEIQLAIYRSCDAPTLFQLMRTCSSIRTEAQKLFWSNPATWYYIEPDWLTFEYGRPGSESHCTKFARYIQQVEVAFIRLDFDFRKSEWPHPNPATLSGRTRVKAEKESLDVKEQARLFWEAFQSNFPAATRVVLSESCSRMLPFSFPKEFAQVVGTCPQGISIHVSTLEFDNDVYRESTRTLYRLRRGEDTSLELVQRGWSRDRIRLPPKKCTGYAGVYQKIRWRGQILNNRSSGIRQIRLKVYEHFHFGGPENTLITCPNPNCGEVFAQDGEWTVHANRTRHDMLDVGAHEVLKARELCSAYYLCNTVPTEVEAPLLEIENEYKRQILDINSEWVEFRKQYGEPGTDKRRAFEEAFLAQLEHDPLYQHHGPVRECWTWSTFKEMLGE